MSDDGKTPVFLAHRAALGAVARRYHLSREETEDALQELFIKVWEHSRNDVSPGQTRSFLFTALRNICIDLLRKRHTVTLDEDAPAGSGPSDSSNAGEASHRAEQSILADAIRRAALAKLSGTNLAVFELYTFAELDYEEIGQQLKITPEAARCAMCRARKVMREECGRLLKP